MRKVTDNSGSQWRVRRRWLPWRRRIRDVPDAPMDMPAGDDPFSAILGLIGLILAIPAFIVIVALTVELLLLVLLLPAFVLVRMLAPVPWTLEVARRPHRRRFFGWTVEVEPRISGWRASRAEMRRIAELLVTSRHARDDAAARLDGDPFGTRAQR